MMNRGDSVVNYQKPERLRLSETRFICQKMDPFWLMTTAWNVLVCHQENLEESVLSIKNKEVPEPENIPAKMHNLLLQDQSNLILGAFNAYLDEVIFLVAGKCQDSADRLRQTCMTLDCPLHTDHSVWSPKRYVLPVNYPEDSSV